MGKSTKLIAGTVAGVLCVTLYATFSSMSIDGKDIINSYTSSLANKTISRVASSFNEGQAGNVSGTGNVGGNLSVHGNTPEIKRYLEIARQTHVEWFANGIPYMQAFMTYKGERIRPDCSGYTHEVLKRAGIYTGSQPGTSWSSLEPYGFKKIYLTAPDQVEDGDIIVWGEGGVLGKHMMIIVDGKNGKYYNWGDNTSIRNCYAGVNPNDYANHDPISAGVLFVTYRPWDKSYADKVHVWRYVGK